MWRFPVESPAFKILDKLNYRRFWQEADELHLIRMTLFFEQLLSAIKVRASVSDCLHSLAALQEGLWEHTELTQSAKAVSTAMKAGSSLSEALQTTQTTVRDLALKNAWQLLYEHVHYGSDIQSKIRDLYQHHLDMFKASHNRYPGFYPRQHWVPFYQWTVNWQRSELELIIDMATTYISAGTEPWSAVKQALEQPGVEISLPIFEAELSESRKQLFLRQEIAHGAAPEFLLLYHFFILGLQGFGVSLEGLRRLRFFLQQSKIKINYRPW